MVEKAMAFKQEGGDFMTEVLSLLTTDADVNLNSSKRFELSKGYSQDGAKLGADDVRIE